MYNKHAYLIMIHNNFYILEKLLRLLDTKRNDIYTYRKEDFNELINLDFLFARKFDINIDKEIVDLIYNYLKR